MDVYSNYSSCRTAADLLGGLRDDGGSVEEEAGGLPQVAAASYLRPANRTYEVRGKYNYAVEYDTSTYGEKIRPMLFIGRYRKGGGEKREM